MELEAVGFCSGRKGNRMTLAGRCDGGQLMNCTISIHNEENCPTSVPLTVDPSLCFDSARISPLRLTRVAERAAMQPPPVRHKIGAPMTAHLRVRGPISLGRSCRCRHFTVLFEPCLGQPQPLYTYGSERLQSIDQTIVVFIPDQPQVLVLQLSPTKIITPFATESV